MGNTREREADLLHSRAETKCAAACRSNDWRRMSENSASSLHPRLEVRALHLWRGDRHLLRGVGFTLEAGQLLQIAGPNGVGKTSLLRCVADLMPVESGDILWRGREIRSDREGYHRELAYLAHANALKNDLTALENLRYGIGLRREASDDELRAMLERLKIGQCADLAVRSLSAGQKRRVAIARVLLTQARLWILDEPITNLDVSGIALVEACMAEHLRAGGMILAAAHQALLGGEPGVRSLELR
jgi:heme exporter protein A